MKSLKFFLLVVIVVASSSLEAQVSIKKDNSPPDSSAILDVQDTTGGVLIPRMTKTQRDAINNPATGLEIYQTTGTKGFYFFNGSVWTAVAGSGIHFPGEPYGGGIVFWVDHTGQHGFICSMVDLSASQEWSNVGDVEIGDDAQSIWNGLGNSQAIIGQQGHVTSAAKLCLDYVNADYGTGTYDDWFLPSTGQAKHLLNNINEVQKTLETDGDPLTAPFSSGPYWTSTEASDTTAWGCDLTGGYSPLIKIASMSVRAVRGF